MCFKTNLEIFEKVHYLGNHYLGNKLYHKIDQYCMKFFLVLVWVLNYYSLNFENIQAKIWKDTR